MCEFKVCVLGQLAARFTEHRPVRFVSLKEQELLCYLVLRRDRAHPREMIAGILWGGATVERSKKYLRNELWRLRNDTFPPDASAPLLTATKESIGLNPEAKVWCDVEALESAFAIVRGKAAADLRSGEVAVLEKAIQLYRGPLLNGWYQDWLQADRDRLQQIYLEIADKLIAFYEVYGHYDKGISLALHVMREEPTSERTHRRLMRLYYHSGDRASALQQFSRCASILGSTLGITPCRETRALNQQLITDALQPPFPIERRESRTDLDGILRRVDALCREVSAMRVEISREIKQIRRLPLVEAPERPERQD
jgi:DNA-binding SARP family transcriptional activator